MSRRNRSEIIKKCILISLSLVLWVCSFGGIFGHNDPELNIEDNPVYKVCDLSSVYNSLLTNYDATVSQYNDCHIVSGIVVDRLESKILYGHSGDCSEIKISTAKNTAQKYSQGNTLAVYGTLDIGKSKGIPTLTVKADYVDSRAIDTNSDYYTLAKDGNTKAYSKSNTVLCSLDDNRIQYRIPASWESVRCTDEGKKALFHSEILRDSDCYFLNELAGSEYPEFFVVFFFDFDHFIKFANEKDNMTSIETAIIKNICPEDKNVGAKKFFFKDKVTYKEKKITYYVSNYDNCKVEFIFNECDEGVCVMMYVHSGEYTYKEDALYVQESLSISK